MAEADRVERTSVPFVLERRPAREVAEIVMNNQDAFERILASLYDAILDDTRWPATSGP